MIEKETTPHRKRVIGVIPSRWGSTRFEGKSLALIAGKPLLQWGVERAQQAEMLDGLMVATDDARIQQAASEWGVQVVMTRSDHPSGTDRIAEAVCSEDADIVVNIQGDEPLIDPYLIDRLVHVLRESDEWDMSTAASPIHDDSERDSPSVVKVVSSREGKALYFSRSVIPFLREKDGDLDKKPLLYWRHIGLYVYRRSFLEKMVKEPPCLLEQAEKLEQLRALFMGARMKVLETSHAGLGVDVPGDIAKAEAAIQKLGLGIECGE